jgi:glyoxylase-like metal-dependent hydrolase (beta-lactamase superfamily II)
MMKESRFFTSRKAAEGVTLIEDLGHVYCYLVEGGEKALLIDTLNGVGNIAEYCRQLTSLPIIPVNTHGHFDHAAGNFAFDEAYIHPDDVKLLYWMGTVKSRMDYIRDMQRRDANPPAWSEADVLPVREMRLLPLHDAQVFDLGGRSIEVIATPGHSQGSCCFLDREHRLLFAGDSCNPRTIVCYMNAATVEEYLASMRKLKARQGEYDTFFVCHGDTPIDKSCVDDAIACCEKIMAGTDDAVPGNVFAFLVFFSNRCDERFRRLDGRIANIVYTKDNIFLKDKKTGDFTSEPFLPYGK